MCAEVDVEKCKHKKDVKDGEIYASENSTGMYVT